MVVGHRSVLASRLGYRITDRFVHGFMGKIFDTPNAVLPDYILRPEKQDLAVFVDGIDNIVEAQQRVAQRYFEDGSIEDACPPLKALLHIMAYGQYEGKDAHHPEIRALFEREALLASDWYGERLHTKQVVDVRLWERHVAYLGSYAARSSHQDLVVRFDISGRLERARARLDEVRSGAYLQSLRGTLGADPSGMRSAVPDHA